MDVTELVLGRIARLDRAFAEVKAATLETILRPEDLPPGFDLAAAQVAMDDAMAAYANEELPKIFVFLAKFGAANERANQRVPIKN